MSKAFVKESDADSAGDDSEKEEGLQLPTGSKNYMTPRGAERLREELRGLLHVERPKLVETVAWAASNGDRSENADYIYGKRRLREIDRRVRFLTKRLEAGEIVNPLHQKGERVLFGATVSVKDEEGRKKLYRIVGVDEADPKQGKVSWISPVGRALLQARVGDAVTVRKPLGEEELEVLQIEYVDIP